MSDVSALDAETLLFFDRCPKALPLYAVFEERLYARFAQTRKRVQKTQITFVNRHVFACVSFARVRKKPLLPDPFITVTLGLPAPLPSMRAAICTQPYPGRWTCHIPIGAAEEIDDELLGWIGQAYDFAAGK